MKILNFGSLNLDYVYSLPHFVTPGETITSTDYKVNAGGKGLNQSISLARAGATVFHAGCVGKEGETLVDILKEAGADTSLIKRVDNATGHAIIQVNDKGENCIIIYGGANQMIDAALIDAAFEKFEAGDILLLQNEINNLEAIINKAYDKKMKIAFNPSPFRDELLKLPLEKITWFLVNEVEGGQISGGENEPEKIIDLIINKYPDSKVVLTLGKHGVMYGEREKRISHPAHDAKVVDTTAAGDTFTGYFLYSICKGFEPEKALYYASKASAVAISIKGAAVSIPYAEQIFE